MRLLGLPTFDLGKAAILLVMISACAMVPAADAAAAPAGKISRYSVNPEQTETPSGLIRGTDGKIWFAANIPTSHFLTAGFIGNITPGGHVQLLTAGAGVGVTAPVASGDGRFWFVSNPGISAAELNRVSEHCTVETFAGAIHSPLLRNGVASAPSGSAFFVTSDPDSAPRRLLNVVDSFGVAVQHEMAMTPGRSAYSVTWGPGNTYRVLEQWTSGAPESMHFAIATMPTSDTSNVTEHDLAIGGDRRPGAMLTGTDGTTWMLLESNNSTSDGQSAIGVLGADGSFTEHTAGVTPGRFPYDLHVGPDGAIWFTEDWSDPDGSSHSAFAKIAADGTVTEYAPLPGSETVATELVVGPNGNQWFAINACAGTACGTPMSEKFGEVSDNGKLVEHESGLPPGHRADQFLLGEDGRLWFTEKWMSDNHMHWYGTIDALELTGHRSVPVSTAPGCGSTPPASAADPSLTKIVASAISPPSGKLSAHKIGMGKHLEALLKNVAPGTQVAITWRMKQHMIWRSSTTESAGVVHFSAPRERGRYSLNITASGTKLISGTIRVT